MSPALPAPDLMNAEPDHTTDVGEPLCVVASDGTLLAARIFPNTQAKRRLVISHGNGLAVFGYRVFWEALRADFEIIAFDFRGHGMSQPGVVEQHHWSQLVTDLESLWTTQEQLRGKRQTVGVFHSMSAVTSLLHSHRYGRRWDALVLFDPPLPPPPGHPLDARHLMEVQALAQKARHRRPAYESPEDLAERFGRSSLFGAWRGSAPIDMARASLHCDLTSGTWMLNCPPEREAHIYQTNLSRLAWDTVVEPPCPVHLIASDPCLPTAQVPSFTSLSLHQETGASYEAISGTGHFLQLEQPESCQSALRRFLASLP